MLIKRVLNHNSAISTNHQGLDILLMGKGIAFGKKLEIVLSLMLSKHHLF